MPYITQERREELEPIVKLMEEKKVIADGDLNYILFALCKRTVKPSYNNYKNIRAELRECADEIGRRLIAPYEDSKIEENGDVE